MNNLQHIQRFSRSHSLVSAAHAQQVLALSKAPEVSAETTGQTLDALCQAFGSSRPEAKPYVMAGSVAVIPMHGALLHRGQREGRQRKLRLLRLLRAFRQAAAALPDAIVVLQRGELRIEWFNEAATRLLALRYPRDFGARFSNLVRAPKVTEWLASGAAEPLLEKLLPKIEALRSAGVHIADSAATIGTTVLKALVH